MDILSMERLVPGDVVKHFKREQNSEGMQYLYEILAFAQHTETEESLVVYKALYGEQKVYARPFDMFFGEVDKAKYPNIKQVYRFEKV